MSSVDRSCSRRASRICVDPSKRTTERNPRAVAVLARQLRPSRQSLQRAFVLLTFGTHAVERPRRHSVAPGVPRGRFRTGPASVQTTRTFGEMVNVWPSPPRIRAKSPQIWSKWPGRSSSTREFDRRLRSEHLRRVRQNLARKRSKLERSQQDLAWHPPIRCDCVASSMPLWGHLGRRNDTCSETRSDQGRAARVRKQMSPIAHMHPALHGLRARHRSQGGQ